MTTSDAPSEGRRRGGIRRHGEGWQARVSAGTDPSTGERIVLYETVPISEARTKAARERAERDAFKEAQKVLTRLQAEADALKVGRTKATVGALLERWMEQHEIDPTTRMTYDAQIRLYIVPRSAARPLARRHPVRRRPTGPHRPVEGADRLDGLPAGAGRTT
jgi:integrase